LATSRSVEQIASEVGYRSPSGFVRAFKKREGMTPSEYRRQMRSRSPEPSVGDPAKPDMNAAESAICPDRLEEMPGPAA
jgi:methylphosphotriester-DNA--protein-cysteine methyltransferase